MTSATADLQPSSTCTPWTLTLALLLAVLALAWFVATRQAVLLFAGRCAVRLYHRLAAAD